MIRIRSEIKVALLFGVLLLSFWIVDIAFRMMNVRSDASVLGGTAILVAIAVLWFNICRAVWKEVKEERERKDNAELKKEMDAKEARRAAAYGADARDRGGLH